MKTWSLKFNLLVLFIHCFAALEAQDTLLLQNPSFEDTPRHSKLPQGWVNCGFRNETPPDIGPTSFFRANTQASAGQTHLIMVTRDNGTWERIGNLLSSPMQGGQCYSFSLDLARSPIYLSMSRVAGTAINFTEPIRLRIWGANPKGKLLELLSVSELVNHEGWQGYTFQLCPGESYPMLVLEAIYAANHSLPYGGNIMLDNCSPLVVSTAKRDEAQLAAWRAETIPTYSRRAKQLAGPPTNDEPDTLLLNQHMQDIERGRIDIGLTELAAYAKGFAPLPWIIVMNEDDQEHSKQYLRKLRKRIKAMELRPYLRVRFRNKLPRKFQYLATQLGVVDK